MDNETMAKKIQQKKLSIAKEDVGIVVRAQKISLELKNKSLCIFFGAMKMSYYLHDEESMLFWDHKKM